MVNTEITSLNLHCMQLHSDICPALSDFPAVSSCPLTLEPRKDRGVQNENWGNHTTVSPVRHVPGLIFILTY